MRSGCSPVSRRPIHKRLQQGVVQGLLYRIAPENIIHSWAEVWFEGRWVGLEGVILDGVRAKFPQVCGSFLGYGVGTDNLAQPPIEWTGTDTAIQATGVNRDYGVFDDPDTFYRAHGPTCGDRGHGCSRRIRCDP